MDTALSDPTSNQPLHGLSFLWLEITAKCNLECVHCYADSDPRQNLFGHMQTEDWLTVIRDSADLGCQQIQFIGGEPTLHPDLARMISFASASGYTFIEVFTNATTLSQSLLQTFAEHNVRIATSFYSDDPETHDLITKHEGSFSRTVAGIKRIVAAGLPVRAGIIEMQENAGHAGRATRFLEGLGVSEIKIDFQRGVGRGTQLIQSLQPMAELCGECWKGKLCVTSLGRVYPCVFSRFADLGTAKSGIHSIVSDDSLLEFRSALRDFRRKKEIKENFLSNGKKQEHSESKYSLAPAGFVVRSCDPDAVSDPDCGPDVRCEPTSSRCGPMIFEPCGPDCAPQAPGCSPLDSCSPAREDIRLEACSPSCNPATTCSPCGPTSFCVPERMCAPEVRCGPTSSPCQPERSCVPTIRGSHQTEVD